MVSYPDVFEPEYQLVILVRPGPSVVTDRAVADVLQAVKFSEPSKPAKPLLLRYLLISFRAFLLSDVLNRHVEVFPVDVVAYM